MELREYAVPQSYEVAARSESRTDGPFFATTKVWVRGPLGMTAEVTIPLHMHFDDVERFLDKVRDAAIEHQWEGRRLLE